MTSADSRQPLGLGVDPEANRVSVYSETAETIDFVILDPNEPSTELGRIALNRDGDIWSATDPRIVTGVHYSFRADGPEGPRHGFNPTIDLIDPYATGVVREGPRDFHCVAIDRSFDWQGVSKPAVPLAETIIYEAHARGLTRGNTALPDELRGTYAALGHESTIAHLKKIGITAVELLPIQAIISEPRLINMGLINYWGYNTINFFTPHHRYATPAAIAAGPDAIARELKTAIRELHRAGIEVIMDVVYNHSAEGGYLGLTHSYRGLDNSSYYRMDDAGNYHDTTGCGNSFNFANPWVVKMTMDSLRYWTTEYQIDGFRFDLATTLARDAGNQYDPNHPLLQQLASDPVLAESKLIMEPWDVGLGGWQTGNFPDPFSEWNDRYRDSVRRFWLTDISSARDSGTHHNGVADLATRLAGSKDIVHGPLGTLGTVNFITAHDGFNLHDLVSHNVKHNQANGESNRDGNNNNFSFNHGEEGGTSDHEVNSKRQKAARNLLATLMFSAGVPMFTAGDERGKTQKGNNNAYCQDNILSWLNWELSAADQDLEDTFALLTSLRKANPSLRSPNFGNFEEPIPGSDMIKWYNADGEIMPAEQWDNPENRTLVRLAVNLDAEGRKNVTLMVIHGAENEISVTLPESEYLETYELLWNSELSGPNQPTKTLKPKDTVLVTDSAILVFSAK
ncbi:MAG: glycogen debranching protein GlgX [Rhodoluna sp.]|nr:glycogen debranching protein GlgX [Rhodoluna sp.]